jgi:cytochrome c553
VARLLSTCIAIAVFSLVTIAGQPPVDAGRQAFTERCALCHGADGTGGTFATSIVPRLAALDETALECTIRNGVPARGMPAFALPAPEMTAVIAYLRTLRPATRGRRDRLEPLHAQTAAGDAIDGLVLRQSFDDLQLRAADGSIRLFRRAGDRFRPVTSETEISTRPTWPRDRCRTRRRRRCAQRLARLEVPEGLPGGHDRAAVLAEEDEPVAVASVPLRVLPSLKRAPAYYD